MEGVVSAWPGDEAPFASSGGVHRVNPVCAVERDQSVAPWKGGLATTRNREHRHDYQQRDGEHAAHDRTSDSPERLQEAYSSNVNRSVPIACSQLNIRGHDAV